MTEVDLLQKRGINSRKFILKDNKIIVDVKSLRKNDKYEVKLDQLGFDIHYRSDNTIPGKLFFFVCITLIIALTILYIFTNQVNQGTLIFNYIIWGTIALITYFKQHQDDIYLTGGQTTLVFYRDIPHEKNVLEFIEKIKTNTRIYLKEKYTNFDNIFSEHDFYNRINWLKDMEIISSSEYAEYKSNFEINRLL
ncbi:hypothetical protein QQY79_08055 [Flavobacterium tructae]|uniref:hypothetical protein n=1 Tax=Flavobacterium tructae TaxID=1114873 RepID=UPI002551F977|nr:hypothetical protein [Flavobacterium tructae]MDL2142471.1 hypothetical protein [Flavobacterium tructae]